DLRMNRAATPADKLTQTVHGVRPGHAADEPGAGDAGVACRAGRAAAPPRPPPGPPRPQAAAPPPGGAPRAAAAPARRGGGGRGIHLRLDLALDRIELRLVGEAEVEGALAQTADGLALGGVISVGRGTVVLDVAVVVALEPHGLRLEQNRPLAAAALLGCVLN